jgi:hypothetical protein
MAGSFDVEINNHGARIVAIRNSLCSRCLLESEIDAHIRRLKDELDTVAERAKRAIQGQRQKPLRLEGGEDA